MKMSPIGLGLCSISLVAVGCSSNMGLDGSGGAPGSVGGSGSGSTSGIGGAATGSGSAPSSGGVAQVGGSTGAGGAGGSLGSGGAVTLGPVDCSSIANHADWTLCGSTDTSCSAVFTDGAGCAAVCAEAGLACSEVWENLDDACGADSGLTALSCDPPSGHQSDYCVCVGQGSPGGSGGSSGVGGAAGSGGTAAGGSMGSGGASGGSGGSSSGNAPCDVPGYIFSDPAPIGWASESGGTTGGGSATPILVTSLSQFQNEVEDDDHKVLYVQGTFSPADISIGSNKTIIGCSSGAHIQGAIGIGSGTFNVIVRNLQISGYGVGNCALDPDFDSGEGCSSGNDAVGINGNAHHVWFDHCSVKDGTDGNLDVTNDADFVTISWTKFSYTARTDNVGDDSTGAAGHRFSNLVGGTDTAPSGWPGTIRLNVTWHHNWWTDSVVERQPRVRYGRNHIFNNYYDSSATNYCVRAGIEAKVLLQGNYFDGVDSPHQFNEDDEATAFISVGEGALANTYSNTSGDQVTEGEGTEWDDPPYDFTVDAASGVPTAVTAGAGPH